MDDQNLFKDVTITAQTVNIGGDVVGRDKETMTTLAPMAVAPTSAPAMMEPAFRLLVIVARPLDVNELPSIADQWELVRGLGQVDAPVSITILRPPTIEALRAELNNGYDAIHFDGHGDFGCVCANCDAFISRSETRPTLMACPRCQTSLEGAVEVGLLCFEKEGGTLEALPAPDLAQMIAAVPNKPTQLVVLSACRSAMGDEHSLAQTLVAGGVPAVIGMKEVVTVTATLAFFRPFYAALGAGATIAEATEIARPALKGIQNPISPTPTHELPILSGTGTGARLCPPGTPKGRVQIEQEPLLVGVPDVPNFFGAFIDGDPPEGRKGLLARIARALVSGERLIALTGTGGIGKTALVTMSARRLAWRFPGGVFWRSAADSSDFRLDHLLDAFAAVFGQQFYTLPTSAKRDAALNYLGDLRTTALVIVDNAETIRDPAVARFLSDIPAPSAALLTTRDAPEYGARVIPVPAMVPEEGAGFFAVEVRRAKDDDNWGRALSADDQRRVLDICRLLDGHPLALLLAAALLRSHDLAGVLALVKANPARGEVGRRFDFSYNLLPTDEKELLHRLATFAAHIRPGFIELLCTHPELFDGDALPNWQAALAELVRKSFVEFVEPHYRLHPIMRQYAAAKAGPDAARRHNFNTAKLLLAFAQQFEQDFDALESELPNLLGVMDWVDLERQVEGSKWQEEAARVVMEMIWTLLSPSSPYLLTRGHWNEARRRLAQAAEAAQQIGDDHSEGAFANARAMIMNSQGELEEAREQYKRALEIAHKRGFKQGEAATLHELGRLAQATGDLAEARRLYGQSLQLKRELGDKWGIANTLGQLGILAQATGDLAEAHRLYDEAGHIFNKLGAKREQAVILHQLGRLAQATGDLAEARRLYDKAGNIFNELGAKKERAAVLHQLATLSQSAGDVAEARRLYDQSLELERELSNKEGIAISLTQIALLEEQEGNLVTALSLIRQAEQLFTELESPMREWAREGRERMEGVNG